jgi:hypothetical protein
MKVDLSVDVREYAARIKTPTVGKDWRSPREIILPVPPAPAVEH